MKTSPSDWVLWDEKEVLPFDGGISFHVRTSTPLVVINEFGLILGFGIGQQEIAVTGKGEITFDCDSDIWLRPSSRVQERIQASSEIFTTLDRPSPLSPEMQAIHRMMRRNEIEREKDRQDMEKRFADRFREDARPKPSVDAQKTPAKKKEKVRDDATDGGVDPENKTPPTGADDEALGDVGDKPTSDKGSPPDS